MEATSVFCTDCGAANPMQGKFCFSCGQALDALDITMAGISVPGKGKATKHANATGQLQPGEVLKKRYKLLSQIGQGGFGAVYKAEDTELGQRLLAVKEMSLLNLKQQEIDEGVEAFKREALMLAGLMHEHLPRIYDHFVENERWYLVMDYIEGETLEAHFEKSRDGSLPLVMAFKIALQLCDVLNYLHSRQPPIVFRDLKPANVIITPAGTIFLIDFGIARHFKPGQAKDTTAFGSPGYAAPEQYGKAQTTPRADIYSLGAILHQMVSGADPSLSPFRFAPLSGHDPALGHLVQRMLEMDEGQRPATIGEVKETLQHLRDHPAPPAPVHVRAGQSLPTIAPAGALSMGFAPPAPVVVHEHHYGVVRAVAWSPDSRYVASATEAIIRVWDARTKRNICSYREHVGEIRHMAWSPTAMRIASISEENKVRIWDAYSGKTISIYPGDPDFKRGVARVLAWSADGRYLVVGGAKYFHVWDTDASQMIYKLRSKSFSVCSSLAWSPDSKVFAAALDDDVLVCVLDARPKNVFYRYNTPVNVVAWSPDGKYLASGGVDRAVHVWNMHADRLVGIYREHSQGVSALCWSPDSRRIVSGSFAANVNVWDALTGTSIVSYYAHAGSVLSLAWSPDGRSILSGGSDRRVCIWQAP